MADCKRPDCEGETYVGPLCKDHFEEFQRSGFPGDVKAWLEMKNVEHGEDDTDETENEGICAHKDCSRKCGADEFCYGCKQHVCEEHSLNWNMPMGTHDVEAHFAEGEDADDFL